jgi:tetratricopeptide (TPR) repeat protein
MKLDGLPLALATAGAYLDQVAISLSDYLRLYKASWLKLQELSPELDSYEDRRLYTTWDISLDHVKHQNKLAANLLQLWAYFDNQDIWFELLHCNSDHPEWIRELTQDELTFNNAIRVLCDHGLVEVDTHSQDVIESRGYSMHACVHSWTIYVLNKQWNEDLAKLALGFVGSHIPEGKGEKWSVQQRLLQHATRCSYIILNDMVAGDDIEWDCRKLGRLFHNQDKLEEAEKMYVRAIQGFDKSLGPEHATAFELANMLGTLYKHSGRLEEAEKVYFDALERAEETYGPTGKTTLITAANLGSLYMLRGKLDEAEKMCLRSFEAQAGDSDTKDEAELIVINNLGLIYREQRKLKEAEDMFLRALQGMEEALGQHDMATLTAINNLGLIYADQNNFVDSEKMHRRALEGYEKAFGPKHTRTLQTVGLLGTSLAWQNKQKEAEEMYARALKGYEEVLGSENLMRNLSALHTMLHLGDALVARGESIEAKSMYTKALTGFNMVLGPSCNESRVLEKRLASLDRPTAI